MWACRECAGSCVREGLGMHAEMTLNYIYVIYGVLKKEDKLKPKVFSTHAQPQTPNSISLSLSLSLSPFNPHAKLVAQVSLSFTSAAHKPTFSTASPPTPDNVHCLATLRHRRRCSWCLRRLNQSLPQQFNFDPSLLSKCRNTRRLFAEILDLGFECYKGLSSRFVVVLAVTRIALFWGVVNRCRIKPHFGA
ncbi:unnamed protein product [Citrullus colocynthis]|uniref:Uncharacterized protein n=1 Tax=Citrullus colocynthis TaxID=252529 RepID=A0ABP0YUC6_9ROSI